MKKDKEQPEDISLGKKHSVLMSTLKRVFVWGKNKEYQLGMETSPNILVTSKGSQKTEPLPKILNMPKVKKVAAGYRHTLFIDMQGRGGADRRQPAGLREKHVQLRGKVLPLPGLQLG